MARLFIGFISGYYLSCLFLFISLFIISGSVMLFSVKPLVARKAGPSTAPLAMKLREASLRMTNHKSASPNMTDCKKCFAPGTDLYLAVHWSRG